MSIIITVYSDSEKLVLTKDISTVQGFVNYMEFCD